MMFIIWDSIFLFKERVAAFKVIPCLDCTKLAQFQVVNAMADEHIRYLKLN
jgi:hypothetical protein